MTAVPSALTHPLTVTEFSELGEEEHGRWELQEGALVMSPSPTWPHNVAAGELFWQLRLQLPRRYRAILDVDVDLGLSGPDRPGTVRRPDLVIVDKNELVEGQMLRAAQLLVVVEIVSPGSVRLDNEFKRVEYAAAGIPRYWILDIERPVTLLDCRLTEEGSYESGNWAESTFRTEEPFPIKLELDSLRD
ncbi:Uma2 family endonuclease [Sciscionella marina]|uniref:Uma2 family endonuclease n=1 Tax=Sciscionella marina TaxID=508770 RepID=UPI00039B4B4C|nr:Uma2 family endonuclease [Sciscionella marina]